MAESMMTQERTSRGRLRRPRQIKVCMLGAKGAGKTCFLAGLAVLSEPNRKSAIKAVHDNQDTADYLDSLQVTLHSGAWPPPNNMTVFLDMTVLVDGTAIDLRVIDYAGEDFTGALRTLDRESVDDLYQFTRDADIFLLLFSPQHDLQQDDGSAASAQALIERQRAHLQAIVQVWREKSGAAAGTIAPPTADLGLVITQCDLVAGLDDPKAALKYFQKHAPNLVQDLSRFAKHVGYFAVSAIGPQPRSTVGDGEAVSDLPPASVNPFGYEPLFRWIREYHARKAWWRQPWVWGIAAAVLLVPFGALFVDTEMRSSRIDGILRSSTLTDIEKVERADGSVNQSTNRSRSEFLRGVLSRFEERLGIASSDDDFQRLANEAEKLMGADTGSFTAEFDGLPERVKTLRRHVRFQKLEKDNVTTSTPESFMADCRGFVNDYRSGEDVERVRALLRELEDKTRAQQKESIKTMPVGNGSQVVAKANAILKFANEHEKGLSEEEVARMRKAAEIALLAANSGKPGQWEVTLVRSGGLTTPYWQTVILSKRRGDGEVLHVFDGKVGGATKEKTWADARATIPWQAGDPLYVRLTIEGRVRDVVLGHREDSGPMSIVMLDGKNVLTVEPGSEGYVNNPYVEFRVTAPGGTPVSSEHWEAVEDYICPGIDW